MGDAYIGRYEYMRTCEAARRAADGDTSLWVFLRQGGIVSAERSRLPGAEMSVKRGGMGRSTSVWCEWRSAEGPRAY